MRKLRKPPRLLPGAVIGIVAPASPMKDESLRKGCEYLERLGYRLKLGRFVDKEVGYLAGADRQRADDLNRMFLDPRVQAIFCARGGYGSPRLLSLLDYQAIARNPKIFVGYSDITSIQLAMLRHCRLVTFSGPMVAAEMGQNRMDAFTEENFWKVLTEPRPLGVLHRPAPNRYQPIRRGKATGPLIGGCLSLIAPIIGTPHMPAPDGSIFFVEDIGEEPYRIDRYLVHFRESGLLRRVGGFVFGQMTDCVPPSDSTSPSLTLDEVIDDFIKPLGIPAMSGLDYGHGDVKYTMPIGARAALDVNGRNCRLEILESAVC
jgi:muramoyltetrapeptide carboxypeptidase